MQEMNKIIVAITGASGAIYAKLLLDKLLTIHDQWQELGVVMSNNARQIWETELDNTDYKNYTVTYYDKYDFNAPFASGSAQYNIMIVVPCSMRTLGAIAHGFGDHLIHRAADVILKERRKLVLAVRETPFNDIHLENMLKLSRMGVIICPPMHNCRKEFLHSEKVVQRKGSTPPAMIRK